MAKKRTEKKVFRQVEKRASDTPVAAEQENQLPPENKAPKQHDALPEPDEKKDVASGFPIVGMGASAGGLEAFQQFFSRMPKDSGMAFVVVAHLSPDHVTLLPELLQSKTEMPVESVVNGVRVTPNRVYVIPANKVLSIRGGTLRLTAITKTHGLKLPIDTFFNSLAADQGSNAIGIVFSGTGHDGTQGIYAIKKARGFVLVQSGNTAAYDGMPSSAMATGLCDFELAPQEMPERLQHFLEHDRSGIHSEVEEKGETPGEKPDENQSEKNGDDHVRPDVLNEIISELYIETQHDFSLYKPNTICRRIERRMSLRQVNDARSYLKLLKDDRREITLLFKDILIGVTHFFRDPLAFDKLDGALGPLIYANESGGLGLRAWVPGCSTGEEAYSIAIALVESMEKANLHLPIQIFATDIDENAISIARAALYPASIASDITPSRLGKYFVEQSDGRLMISKDIRRLLVFAQHNVAKDPPFTKLDLISCRNLLIYFGQTLQKSIIPLFRYSLNQNGLLFLGSSESVGASADLFSIVDKKSKIYKRKGGASALPHELIIRKPLFERARLNKDSIDSSEDISAMQLVESILRESKAPPTVIVDHNFDVIYVHGKTGRYLEPAEGKGSMNLLNMARAEIKSPLSRALQTAFSTRTASVIRDIQLTQDGRVSRLEIKLKPLLDHAAIRGLLMVVFQEMPVEDEGANKTSVSRPKDKLPKRKAANIAQVEQELQHARDDLQASMEEFEAANEELRATNEELQSTNEELQSTNEEMETSKEELQSLNEELTTTNSELQGQIESLNKANDNLKNLLDSSEIATLFLDENKNIRLFTPGMTDIVPLTQTDIGRSITHFSTSLQSFSFTKIVDAVLLDLTIKDEHVQDEGKAYRVRARPYRRANNAVDGVVLTFENITERLQLQRILVRQQSMLFEILSDASNMYALKDADYRFEVVNQAFCEFVNKPMEEIIGKTDAEVFPENEVELRQKIDREVFSSGTSNTQTYTRSNGTLTTELVTLTSAIHDRDSHKCVGLLSSTRLANQ